MQLWIIQFLWNIPRCLPRLLYALASHDSLLIRYHLCYITFKDTHAFTELDGYSSKLCDYKLDANFKKSTHTYMPRCYELKKQERWKKLSPYPAKTYIHKTNKFIIFSFFKPSQVIVPVTMPISHRQILSNRSIFDRNNTLWWTHISHVYWIFESCTYSTELSFKVHVKTNSDSTSGYNYISHLHIKPAPLAETCQ